MLDSPNMGHKMLPGERRRHWKNALIGAMLGAAVALFHFLMKERGLPPLNWWRVSAWLYVSLQIFPAAIVAAIIGFFVGLFPRK